MGIFLVGMVLMVVISGFGVFYLTKAIGKFGWIQRLSGENRRKNRSISAALLLGFLALFTALLSFLDAVVILLHILFFFLAFGPLCRWIERKNGQGKIYRQAWLALAAAGVYLLLGYYQCVHVRKTEYTLSTEKPLETLRIAVLADAHIGATFDGAGFASHVRTIRQQAPDLILIPGDFVDESTKYSDLLTACEALAEAAPKYGVWFAYGNHDKGYLNRRDFSPMKLAQTLKENGIHILEDEVAQLGKLCIVGRQDAGVRSRRDLSELLEGIPADSYIIVLDHQPTDYENEAATAADLVVSGHTHGGQMIPLNLIGEWFGGNNRSYGYERRSGTDFVVTSGISDWVLHFKTGTHSEYVLLTVTAP